MISYDPDEDIFGARDLAVSTFDSPDDRLGFMNWMVRCYRSVDPRRMMDCTIRFHLPAGKCEFLYRGDVLDRYYPKGWQ